MSLAGHQLCEESWSSYLRMFAASSSARNSMMASRLPDEYVGVTRGGEARGV